MLPAFVLWMIRRYEICRHLMDLLKKIRTRLKLNVYRRAAILLIIHLFSYAVKAQVQKHTYEVIHNGEVIGHMYFHQIIQGCSTHLKVESEVTGRFIILLIIKTKEETIYENGILVYSSIYRKFNGKDKINIQTKLEDNVYQVNNKGSIEQFKSYPIRFNLQSMYGTEPKEIRKAYADNFSEFVPVEKTGMNEYKVTLPDGSYNIYFYLEGICTRVEVHHTLYSLKFVLMK